MITTLFSRTNVARNLASVRNWREEKKTIDFAAKQGSSEADPDRWGVSGHCGGHRVSISVPAIDSSLSPLPPSPPWNATSRPCTWTSTTMCVNAFLRYRSMLT